MVAGWNPFVCLFKSTGFTSSTFPIQPDSSQNQPAAITLNTGSPRTLSNNEGLLTPAGGRASRRPPPAGSHFSFVFRQQQWLGATVEPLARSQAVSVISTQTIRAALHLEAGPIPLEADCMKFSTFYREVAG
jgi:hypothetical protein